MKLTKPAFILALLIQAPVHAHEMHQCEIDLLPEQPAQRTFTAPTVLAARVGFQTRFGTPALDCDPENGQWTCSDTQIGTNAPRASVSPSEPVSPIPALGPLLILNYDSWPDQDDHQAVLLARYVVTRLNLDPIVVVGAHGENGPHLSFIAGSQAHWRSVFPDTLDAFSQRQQSVRAVAERISAQLANGGSVNIAEGGPSDFTARVLREVLSISPNANLKRVSVYQHSTGATAFNEAKTLPENLALIKSRTTYVRVPNGNVGGNGSADFQEPASSAMCQRFRQRVSQGQYAAQWDRAYSLIGDARKCDASDAVELLKIVGDNSTMNFDQFYGRYIN